MTETAVEWKRGIWYGEGVNEFLVPGETRVWFQYGENWIWGTVHPGLTSIHYSTLCIQPDDATLGDRRRRVYIDSIGGTGYLTNVVTLHLNEQGYGQPVAYAVDLDARPADLPHEKRAQRCLFCRQPTGEFCDPMFEVRKFKFCEGCRNLPDANGNLTNVENQPDTHSDEEQHETYDEPDNDDDYNYNDEDRY